jgi:hypothetical protein
MSLTRYAFRDAVAGFFEFPTENARRILPSHLEPAELHHGSSVFSLTAFDFHESEVGPYGEVVMAVIVAPVIRPGEKLPQAAFYPYQVATTTRRSREHAIERWHLPHWMEDVEVDFDRDDPRRMGVRVSADGAPVAEMTVSDYEWSDVSHLYQCLMKDGEGAYLAQITMEGEHSDHEEETGSLRLYPHAFNKHLSLSEVSDVPFREMWMKDGVQLFQPLVQLETV